jgi:hypothetical protein
MTQALLNTAIVDFPSDRGVGVFHLHPLDFDLDLRGSESIFYEYSNNPITHMGNLAAYPYYPDTMISAGYGKNFARRYSVPTVLGWAV